MTSSHSAINAYETRIKAIISRKKAKITKRAMLQGNEQAELVCAPYIAHLHNASKKVLDTKISCLIKNAQIIVERQLIKSPRLIIPMAIKILKSVAEHTDVDLCAHPVDASIIRENLHEILAQAGSARKICVMEDDSFARGSMLVKANKSIIDAHIKTQIEKARELISSRVEFLNG